MALYQPQEVYPTLDETVDATSSAVSFTVKIRGTVCVKYIIYIYDIATNTQQYTSTVTLGTALKDGETLSISVDMSALGADSYYWYIKLYDTVSTYVTSQTYTFIASTPPSIAFSPSVPSTVTTPSRTFACTYTQAESIGVKSFTMTLYDSLGTTVIATSDEQTEYPDNITYTFNGLISGQSYNVQCVGYTQGNVYFATALSPFTVSYVTPISLAQPTAVPNNDTSVTVGWPNVKSNVGDTDGTVSYEPNYLYTGNYGLNMAAAASCSFYVDFSAPFTVHWVSTVDPSFVGAFGEVKDTAGVNYIYLGYDGSRFFLCINGDYYYDPAEVLTGNPYILAIIHDGITITSYHKEAS